MINNTEIDVLIDAKDNRKPIFRCYVEADFGVHNTQCIKPINKDVCFFFVATIFSSIYCFVTAHIIIIIITIFYRADRDLKPMEIMKIVSSFVYSFSIVVFHCDCRCSWTWTHVNASPFTVFHHEFVVFFSFPPYILMMLVCAVIYWIKNNFIGTMFPLCNEL